MTQVDGGLGRVGTGFDGDDPDGGAGFAKPLGALVAVVVVDRDAERVVPVAVPIGRTISNAAAGGFTGTDFPRAAARTRPAGWELSSLFSAASLLPRPAPTAARSTR